MILMVASRVTLSHGGHGLELEKTSKTISLTAILILLAAITRISAPWVRSYESHLVYSALLWIIAVCVWAFVFLPKMFQDRTHA